jgi:hypothetical protein
MTRHERYGFGRVLLAGLFVWAAIALHVVFAMAVFVTTGLVAVFGWRLIGTALRRHVEQSRRDRVVFSDHGMDHGRRRS